MAKIKPIPEDFIGHEDELSDWQEGSSKPDEEGDYLRDFDGGKATSTWNGTKWLKDGFFPSDIQDAPWCGIAA